MGPPCVRSGAALAALVAAVSFAAPATLAQQSPTARTRILVGFDPGVRLTAQRDALGDAGATVNGPIRSLRIFVATVPTAGRGRALAELRRDPRVRFAEQDPTYSVDTLPNDQYVAQLWGLSNTGQAVNGSTGTADADIEPPEAWSTTPGSHSVVVAVIDT